MATFISHSPADTERLGQQLAKSAQAGSVLGLVGDLGAGKTQFVKGFARGLGVHEPVLSPSFAIVHVYTSGRLPLYHLDFYRLDTAEQIIAAGLEQYFNPDGIALIEWWDRWQGPLPSNLRTLSFQILNESERQVTYDDPGA
jgi:tRNA threonylcarbamoyladenosine biosynthesis protein TsaE